MKLIEDVPTVVPDGGYGGFTPSSIAKRRPEEMRRIPWEELLEMRKRAEGNQQLQDFLSSYEHGAYARETVKENPAMFIPISVAIPAYHLKKKLTGFGRSKPSLSQVTEGYRGAVEGLVESFKQLTQLNVKLHAKQLEIFNDKTRFQVVAAGRRFGKSRLAAWKLLIEALKSKEKDVFYVAPTYQQAKDIMWQLLKELGHEVISASHENTSVLTLVNGRRIYLKGSDRPDTLRGVGLAYVVLDEYADMKSTVWEQILRPALADVQGGALFIGTPKGRNHFYELHKFAESGKDNQWAAFHYTSYDNPMIPNSEIEAAKTSMSSFAFRQEFLSSFEAASRDLFKEEWITIDETEPKDGSYFIAVDLAGFINVDKESGNKNKKLDETAIAVVKASEGGWWVADILHGRWDIKRTCQEIMKAVIKYEPVTVGIEKGSLKNACLPYLQDLMRANNRYFRIDDVTHGNQKKTDRIVWSLQGRFENGKVTLNEGEWNNEFIDQLVNFPNSQMHDDLIDALSYVDQIQIVTYQVDYEEDEWEPLDVYAGV